jgi:hypothetical protein
MQAFWQEPRRLSMRRRPAAYSAGRHSHDDAQRERADGLGVVTQDVADGVIFSQSLPFVCLLFRLVDRQRGMLSLIRRVHVTPPIICAIVFLGLRARFDVTCHTCCSPPVDGSPCVIASARLRGFLPAAPTDVHDHDAMSHESGP